MSKRERERERELKMCDFGFDSEVFDSEGVSCDVYTHEVSLMEEELRIKKELSVNYSKLLLSNKKQLEQAHLLGNARKIKLVMKVCLKELHSYEFKHSVKALFGEAGVKNLSLGFDNYYDIIMCFFAECGISDIRMNGKVNVSTDIRSVPAPVVRIITNFVSSNFGVYTHILNKASSNLVSNSKVTQAPSAVVDEVVVEDLDMEVKPMLSEQFNLIVPVCGEDEWD